jgi:hypothetical protein
MAFVLKLGGSGYKKNLLEMWYVGSPAVFYGMFPSSLFHHPLAQSLACIRRILKHSAAVIDY